jgi:hypothetical protein
MHVGRDACRLVERPRADEGHDGIGVATVERDLALRTAKDLLGRAVVARHLDRLGLARRDLDAVSLDQDVDDERATCLPLTIEAVAAVDEERVARQPVADRLTRAATLEKHTQLRYFPLRSISSMR